MEARFRAGGADGFNIMPATLPGGLDDFIALVLPELRRRGLFREEYEGSTLREHLGSRPPPGFGPGARRAVRTASAFSAEGDAGSASDDAARPIARRIRGGLSVGRAGGRRGEALRGAAEIRRFAEQGLR